MPRTTAQRYEAEITLRLLSQVGSYNFILHWLELPLISHVKPLYRNQFTTPGSVDGSASGELDAKRPSLPIAPSIDFGESNSIPDFPRLLPLWLNPAYAKQIVKGNLMTLSSKTRTVEQGEWIAHQVIEHYRLLWNFVRVIIKTDDDGRAICTCPKMSAGNHNPTLAGLVLSTSSDDWIGKRSGFPEDFASTCQTLFLQLFRVYPHLYWEHFVEPFYYLNLEKQLSSCFSHFVLTAMTLNMLEPHDMELLQDLIDLWAADDTFSPDSKPYQNANLNRGSQLLRNNISLQANWGEGWSSPLGVCGAKERFSLMRKRSIVLVMRPVTELREEVKESSGMYGSVLLQ
ncbi:hypothetical protein B7463_g8295, partial [Scytalidium lignicola]